MIGNNIGNNTIAKTTQTKANELIKYIKIPGITKNNNTAIVNMATVRIINPQAPAVITIAIPSSGKKK